ncbi:MAG TPA: ATP synthase F0 subunit B [Blastocatellia bacterium]|nr:ATP synthase F0 subunit B [Blastocatellia bacterium]
MTIQTFTFLALLLQSHAEPVSLLSNPDLWRVINIVVFALILVYILRNKIGIGKVFDNRAASIVKELEQAKRDKEDALKQLAGVEARLGRLDQELAEIRLEAEREAAREAERIHHAAAADAEKIRQSAHREIEGAMKSARSELRAFVADQAVQMAEAIIRKEIRPEDASRMLTRYTEELGEVKR